MRNVPIKILEESEQDREKWNSDKESYEPKEMLRDDEYEEGDKNRKVHVWWDDFWIEDICFDGMNHENHEEDPNNSRELSITITDDDDGDSWENRSKYGDKSKNKDDKGKSKDKRKGTISYHKTDDDKSNDSENSIHEGNDGLCLEYCSKSASNLGRDDGILAVEETKIPILHETEKSLYLTPLDDKDIGKYNSDKELHKDRSSILDIDERSLKHVLDILFVQKVCKEFFCPEVYTHLALYLCDEFLSLCGKSRGVFHEIFYFISDSWHETHKKENDDTHENDIENGYHDIGCCVFCGELLSSCFVSMESPIVKLLGKRLSSTDKEISKDEGDEKKCEKVAKEISSGNEKREGEYLLEELFWENEREESFDHRCL